MNKQLFWCEERAVLVNFWITVYHPSCKIVFPLICKFTIYCTLTTGYMPRTGLSFFLSILKIILHIPCENSSRLLVLSHFTEKETEARKGWKNDSMTLLLVLAVFVFSQDYLTLKSLICYISSPNTDFILFRSISTNLGKQLPRVKALCWTPEMRWILICLLSMHSQPSGGVCLSVLKDMTKVNGASQMVQG